MSGRAARASRRRKTFVIRAHHEYLLPLTYFRYVRVVHNEPSRADRPMSG